MPAGKDEPLLKQDSSVQQEVPERAVHMIFLTIFIDTLAATISTPVMPFYAKMFGASTQKIGYLFAAWSFCSTFFAPALGKASDTYGRRPVLITALIGAGVANLCQGLSFYSIEYFGESIAFYIFGFFRAFSGVWAAIGTVTNVYLADTIPKSLLPDYMAKVSIVQPLAFTFGPGLGGGLATIGGNNFPVMVDGLITLLSAFIVASNLPETPAFIKLKLERDAKSAGDSGAATEQAEVPKIPMQVYVLSAAAFFGGLVMSASVSMQAIFLSQVYELDVLHVTYVSVGTACTMILTGMFVSARVKNCFGLKPTIIGCNMLGGALYMFAAYCGENRINIWFFLIAMWLNSMQSSIAGACTGPLLQGFAETSNRGKINSTNQLCMNFGRMVGPLVYGKVAMSDINQVWVIAGVAIVIKAFLTIFVKKPEVQAAPALQRKASSYGNEWEDEVGSLEDEKQLGKFVGNLLTKNHYKWISRRSEIEALLEHMLPALSVESKDKYEKQFHDLEMSFADFADSHK
mmetsp:Transcript_107898/g.170422  ORF Transcript_107898/g.170422 Transcript_107898/m.170422 type:complete len:517 (-) Transcript_107898:13-1563(-)